MNKNILNSACYILILYALFSFNGCMPKPEPISQQPMPTEENYKRQVESWIGSSADSLVIRWGVPSKEFPLSAGKKVYEYYNSITIPFQWSGGATLPVTADCRTSFVITATGIVDSVTYVGNRCKAN